MTAYSDIELLVLVDSCQAKFDPCLLQLLTLFEFVMGSIGEPDGFHLDVTAKRMLHLYRTPSEVADYLLHTDELVDGCDRLMMVCSLVHAVYLAGNEKLYVELQKKIIQHLQDNDGKLAKQLAKEQLLLHLHESGYGDSKALLLKKESTLKTVYLQPLLFQVLDLTLYHSSIICQIIDIKLNEMLQAKKEARLVNLPDDTFSLCLKSLENICFTASQVNDIGQAMYTQLSFSCQANANQSQGTSLS